MLALLQHGATITARNKCGDTALHRACLRKHGGLEAAVDLLLRRGADEKASNHKNQTPVDMLDEEPENELEFELRRDRLRSAITVPTSSSTYGEIERTRLLLSRAPADRVWRRRGWLVMLRSRADKTTGAGVSCDSNGSEFTDDPGAAAAAGGPRRGQGCKTARREGAGSGGGDHVVRERASSGVGLGGGDRDGGVSGGVVALLVELEPEGVFRAVLSFL